MIFIANCSMNLGSCPSLFLVSAPSFVYVLSIIVFSNFLIVFPSQMMMMMMPIKIGNDDDDDVDDDDDEDDEDDDDDDDDDDENKFTTKCWSFEAGFC